MEMKKRRQKTLTGLFLKFAALFCLDTFGIGMFCLVLLVLSPMTGFTLPANYAELQLNFASIVLDIGKYNLNVRSWMAQRAKTDTKD